MPKIFGKSIEESMKEVVINEKASWRTFVKYGVLLPALLCAVAAAPLIFGPLALLGIVYYKDYYFKEEEIEEL